MNQFLVVSSFFYMSTNKHFSRLKKKEKYQPIAWKPRAGKLANLQKVLKEETSELRFLLITLELIQAPTGKPQLKPGTQGTKQDPVGLLGTEALLCLPSLVCQE